MISSLRWVLPLKWIIPSIATPFILTVIVSIFVYVLTLTQYFCIRQGDLSLRLRTNGIFSTYGKVLCCTSILLIVGGSTLFLIRTTFIPLSPAFSLIFLHWLLPIVLFSAFSLLVIRVFWYGRASVRTHTALVSEAEPGMRVTRRMILGRELAIHGPLFLASCFMVGVAALLMRSF